MNNVSLVGRITKDPELKTYGKKDGSLCRFTLAIRDGVDADGEERTQFISCIAWNKSAEILEKYVSKGQLVAITGRCTASSYENEDGETVYKQEVTADRVELIAPKKKEEDGDDFGEPKGNKKNRKSKK